MGRVNKVLVCGFSRKGMPLSTDNGCTTPDCFEALMVLSLRTNVLFFVIFIGLLYSCVRLCASMPGIGVVLLRINGLVVVFVIVSFTKLFRLIEYRPSVMLGPCSFSDVSINVELGLWSIHV